MDLNKVKSHVSNLAGGLKDLSQDKDFEEFLTIIHKPGWTSQAEGLLVNGLLESMNMHVQHLKTLKKSLLAGARAVVTK
jgi:hypothetical protein